jgi:hypothetical protein
MVQDVVQGVKRDDFSAPQDKRKQDSGNREKGAGPAAKDAQGKDQTNQEQHRQDCDGDYLGRSSNLVFVPALREIHEFLVYHPTPVEDHIEYQCAFDRSQKGSELRDGS